MVVEKVEIRIDNTHCVQYNKDTQCVYRRVQMEKKDRLIKLRESTGMNRRQFAEYFEIPYRTVQDWELGSREMPEYLLRLIAYKLRMEQLIKSKGDTDEQK